MPLFFFGPVPDHLPRALSGSVTSNPVGCYILQNGRIARDGIVACGGAALTSDALNLPEEHVRPLAPALFEAPSRRIAGAAACIHGPGYRIYGHWLVDFLPRLHLLRLAGYRPEHLRFLLPHDCPRFAFDLLLAAGVPPGNLIPYHAGYELIEADELILPNILRKGSLLHGLFEEATRAWTSLIQPPSARGGPARLFVSRAKHPSARRLLNQARIEAMAEAAGFTIIHPESLPLREQATLFAGARQVLGEYGSALHNTIFGTPALHCCALRGTSHWGGLTQSWISAAFGQTHSYVFGDAGTIMDGAYDWEINKDDFARALTCLEIEAR